MAEPPSIDANEITTRATSTAGVLERRAASVEMLHADPAAPKSSSLPNKSPSMTKLRSAVLASLALAGTVVAQDQPIRIGVLNDQSSVYADFQGAARCSRADGGRGLRRQSSGRRLDVVFADHQNKPDVGSVIARKWLDQDGVDLIVDIPNSAVALAVNEIVRQKNKVLIGSGAEARSLPIQMFAQHRALDLRHLVVRTFARPGRGGARGKTWFFITADYAFGHDLERQATDQVVKTEAVSWRRARADRYARFFVLPAGCAILGAQVVALRSRAAIPPIR